MIWADEMTAEARIALQGHETVSAAIREEARYIANAYPSDWEPALAEPRTITGRWHSLTCACDACLNVDFHIAHPGEFGFAKVNMQIITRGCGYSQPGYSEVRYASHNCPDDRGCRRE